MSEEGRFRGGLPATDLTAYGESPTPERRLDDQTLLTAGATTPISTQWSGNQVIHAKHDEEADVAHSGRKAAEPNIGETLSWRNPPETMRDSSGQLSTISAQVVLTTGLPSGACSSAVGPTLSV